MQVPWQHVPTLYALVMVENLAQLKLFYVFVLPPWLNPKPGISNLSHLAFVANMFLAGFGTYGMPWKPIVDL